MKIRLLAPLALAGLLPAGLAGGEGPATRVKIPFDFVVKGSGLPAGSYSVSSRRNLLILRGPQDTTCVLSSGLTSRDERQAKLVFLKRGRAYFLREVWMGGGLGREIAPSHGEPRPIVLGDRQPEPASLEEVVVRAGS